MNCKTYCFDYWYILWFWLWIYDNMDDLFWHCQHIMCLLEQSVQRKSRCDSITFLTQRMCFGILLFCAAFCGSLLDFVLYLRWKILHSLNRVFILLIPGIPALSSRAVPAISSRAVFPGGSQWWQPSLRFCVPWQLHYGALCHGQEGCSRTLCTSCLCSAMVSKSAGSTMVIPSCVYSTMVNCSALVLSCSAGSTLAP